MSQEPCDSGIGKEDDGAMGEKGLVDEAAKWLADNDGRYPCKQTPKQRKESELAKWLADNDGRYPRKQTPKQRKESEWSCLEHRLFLYVRRQKEALSKGKGSESVEERARQLSNISLVTHEASWNDKYNALREFLARGDPGAPAYPKQKAADVEEKKLATWITYQRRVHQAGQLCGERERALYQLRGWRWADHESPWFQMYVQLRSWIRRGGNLEELAVEASGKFRGEKCHLANWVQQQRQGFKRKKEALHLSVANSHAT